MEQIDRVIDRQAVFAQYSHAPLGCLGRLKNNFLKGGLIHMVGAGAGQK